jgi:uncharacterized membrane-anchored protein YhcB (DUF1043 family)
VPFTLHHTKILYPRESQQMIAELMQSYQRVSDHFANSLARPQEVIDDDEKLDPLIAQTKVEKESPQDEEAVRNG